MADSKKIRLFGDLWLPDPEQALPDQELTNVKRFIPLIQCLESDWIEDMKERPSEWILDEAYNSFIEKEANWWKTRGVMRPRYMVRPSGHLNSPVACHLYNPTFTVDDPYCRETEDLSNPSIAQVNAAGFSSRNNCLLFDHLARRDISRHCTDVYPEDLYDIHEEFVFALRDAMTAKIEVCWGANVRNRMIKKLDLQPFRLWGEYAGIVLYLEMMPGRRKIKRFVIFVSHPQRFFYVKSDGEKAQDWRRRFGVSQDQALTAAARLGGIRIAQNFYESDPRLLQNLRVSRSVSEERNVWKGQAVAQLKKAFPTAVLSMETSHRLQATKEDKSSVQDAFALLAKIKPNKVSETINLPKLTDDTNLRRRRLQKITDYWSDLEALSSTFSPNASTSANRSKTPQALAAECPLDSFFVEFQESDCWEWEDLPHPLVEFIHAQDGLKFNRREISCRKDLELAFNQLQKCKGSSETLDILTLAFSVLAAYGWMIARPRMAQIDDMLILRDPPYDVVPRKCSACGKEYLDDPFAYWSKSNHRCYVLWYRFRSSCGRLDCKTKSCELLPLDVRIKYSRSTKKDLEEKSLNQFDKWFLLHPEEFGELPSELEVKCQTEDCQETKSIKARWTGHTPPRFVVAVHKCRKTQRRSNWKPTGYPTVMGANLSGLWKRFCEVPQFDITCYPRRPDIYFDESLSIAGRVAALIEAQRLIEARRSIERTRKACETDDS